MTTGFYQSKQIKQLDGIEHARRRVGNALGTDPYVTALREIVDNSADEISKPGHGDTITIKLYPGESVEVIDNGWGLPVDFDSAAGMNGIQKTLGSTYSGGKFDDNTGTAGLNGIGAAAANAISDRFDVTVWSQGKEYRQSFRHGRPGHFAGTDFDPDASFERLDAEKLKGKPTNHASGTSVRLVFDRSLVKDAKLDIADVLFRAHCSVRMIPGAKLYVENHGWHHDIPDSLLTPYEGDGGNAALYNFVQKYALSTDTPPAFVLTGKGLFNTTATDPREFTFSLAAAPQTTNNSVYGFVNSVYTVDGGSHIPASTKGIGEALAERSSRLRNLGLQKGEEPPTADDFAATTWGTVSVIAPEIDFHGQAKSSVKSPSLSRALTSEVQKQVALWAASPANSEVVLKWAKIALEYARTRRSVESAVKARRAQSSKITGENLSLPEKLVASARSGRDSGAEIIFCEGDSAKGTIVAARDGEFQAVYPLRGTPPNTYNMTVTSARKKDGFEPIAQILGCGVKDQCDPDKCRYDRILFASDADPDGGHINALLLSMFFEYYRPLIEQEMVLITVPPLFVVKHGDDRHYALNEEERDAIRSKLVASGVPESKLDTQRNKGLGEMDADDFWDTVLNPKKRVLYKVKLEDEKRVSELQNILYGPSAEARRKWIFEMESHLDLSEIDLSD